MKRIFSIILSLIILIGCNIPAYCKDAHNLESKSTKVYSEEYPDAYIILEYDDDSVNATVFWEEVYTEVNNEIVVDTSRLLTESEVMAIGIENFAENTQLLTSSGIPTSSRGKLTISLDATYTLINDGIYIDVDGNANWSGTSLIYSAVNNPAVGNDYFGLSWGGNYTVNSLSCAKTWNTGITGYATLEDFSPNASRVFSFDEYGHSSNDPVIYIKNAEIYGSLTKESLSGDGNTTEIGLKYIHTYQTISGGVSVSFDSSPSVGFSVSPVTNQWSIVCVVGSFPY